MSTVLKCDITGETIADIVNASSEWTVKKVNRTINGKVVSVSIILSVDAFAGAQPTNLSDNGRKAVVSDVKILIAALS